MDMGVRQIDLRTEHPEAAGDTAYEIGSATLTIHPGTGTAATDTVKYVGVWNRHGGGPWQLAVDIWNGKHTRLTPKSLPQRPDYHQSAGNEVQRGSAPPLTSASRA